MAYKISTDCLACGICQVECLNNAISEGEDTYVIDPAKCTECIGFRESARCAEICPVGAPVLDPDIKEGRKQLLEKWKMIHPKKTPA